MSQTSEYHTLYNGVPQGGILSTLLFNCVIELLMNLEIPGSKLFAYADDIAIVCRNRFNAGQIAQNALKIVAAKCEELGLKISLTKTKCMAMLCDNPKDNIKLGETDIDWVNSYRYLGVVLDKHLNLAPLVDDIVKRQRLRLNVMAAISGFSWGANAKVLRMFYVQAIRSLTDYAAPILSLLLTDMPRVRRRSRAHALAQLHKLELVHNQAC